MKLPNKEEALACPKNLSEKGKRAHKVIMETLLKGMDNPGGCKTFYSPQEWQERGEEYGLRSELVVVCDGGDIRPYFFYGDLVSLLERMNKALAEAGLYFEACTGWYGAIYPL